MEIDSSHLDQATIRPVSNAHATLKVHWAEMSDLQRDRLMAALSLLEEAGITFDTGHRDGCYDFELDWSMVGASLIVHDPMCKGCSRRFLGVGYTVLNDGYQDAYCSQECLPVPNSNPTIRVTFR